MLNKQEPGDNDTSPFDEFVKYVQFYTIPNPENPAEVDSVEYVKAEDVPKILFGVFVSKPDFAHIDPTQLALKLSKKSSVLYENKRIIEHILDHAWV